MESPNLSKGENAAGMRTLVGVDVESLYAPALELLGRLRFAGNQLTLAHVAPAVGPPLNPAPLVYDYRNQAELEERLKMVGAALLDEAARRAIEAKLGEGLEKVYAVGSSSTILMKLADERKADLVAIGSDQLGLMGSIFLGSVGRALAIGGDSSFLVARNVPKGDALHVVFATDHSEYASRCFQRFLDMDPQGVGKVTIVTATDPRFETRVAHELGIEDEGPYALSKAEARLREIGEHKANRWRQRGVEVEYRLVEGRPADALKWTMEETQADLLVLGARGHGLIERVLIGSLALHTVVAESYPVLVLRMPEAA